MMKNTYGPERQTIDRESANCSIVLNRLLNNPAQGTHNNKTGKHDFPVAHIINSLSPKKMAAARGTAPWLSENCVSRQPG